MRMSERDDEDFSADRLEAEVIDIERARRPEPAAPPWKRAPELVRSIMARAKDPWVTLTVGGELLARVRAGGTVVIIGGSGSGKSSLTLCMLAEHARDVGPAIMLSIELPEEEAGARLVGQKCDASWEDALTGKVPEHEMERVLDLPRLYVLDRRRATIGNLEKCVDAARAEYPGQPILVAIDYAQLLDSKEREARQKVSDVFAQIDDCAREKKFVAIALSQMSRASAQKARKGDSIGAESADLGAESAAIERFATLTLSIGLAVEREDGSSAVELSVGKARMSKGDKVWPMTYWGRSGLWRVAGEAQLADQVREKRESEKKTKEQNTVSLALVAAARKATAPSPRKQLMDSISGRTSTKVAALNALLTERELVEVNIKQKGSRHFLIWTPDLASANGLSERQANLL
jgi:ABC-type dipeptide/oligopeptide/nickel transport system ATPase subunit